MRILSLSTLIIWCSALGEVAEGSPAPQFYGGKAKYALSYNTPGSQGSSDTCQKCSKVANELQINPLVTAICSSQLKLSTAYVTLTLTKTETVTRGSGSSAVEVVVTETPDAVTQSVLTTDYLAITTTATALVTKYVNTTISTITVREGDSIPQAQEAAASTIPPVKGSYKRRSLNPGLLERGKRGSPSRRLLEKKTKGTFGPGLLERGYLKLSGEKGYVSLTKGILQKRTDSQLYGDASSNYPEKVRESFIQIYGSEQLSCGCACLNFLPPTTETIFVTKIVIDSYTLAGVTVTKTSIPSPLESTTIITTTITGTSTSAEEITTTVPIPATATHTLPKECFPESRIGYRQAVSFRQTASQNQGTIPYEECCYRCWNTPDCVYYSYLNYDETLGNECVIYVGTDEVDERNSAACPKGVFVNGWMEGNLGNVVAEHAGPCMGLAVNGF